MSIFLEVLGQAEAKLNQMAQQMENIRWMAENGRYEASVATFTQPCGGSFRISRLCAIPIVS